MPIAKFTPAQVLAALNDIGRPASTTQIARRARERAGLNAWPEYGNRDVTDALTALVSDGQLVQAKGARYGQPKPDNPHQHIVGHRDSQSRWYATPAMADRWREHLTAVAAANQLAITLIEEFGRLWQAMAGDIAAAHRGGRIDAGGQTPDLWLDTHPERMPWARIQADAGALGWLVSLLRGHVQADVRPLPAQFRTGGPVLPEDLS